jgi:hypothetical protein
MVTKTPNYSFELVDFNVNPWHTKEHNNWRIIDTVFSNFLTVSNLQGVWENAIAVTIGQKYVDPDLSTMWECLVAHTTASTGTFATDRTNNASYWVASTVQVTNRGAYAQNTAYSPNDFVVQGGKYGICQTSFTSDTTGATTALSYAVDVAAGDIITLIDTDVLAPATSLNIAETITVTGILDEDTMASDSATALVTQQSVKAFVAASLTTLGGLAATDGNVAVANGTEFAVDNLLTAKGGTVRHEHGGIEANISAITTDEFLVGTSAGVIQIRTVAQVLAALGLAGVEAAATADQTGAEIATAISSETVAALDVTAGTGGTLALSGIFTSTGQPMFSARGLSAQNNVTGNGTNYTMQFTTVDKNISSDFDGTSTYTAEVDGMHHFSAQIALSGTTTAAQDLTIKLVTSNLTVQRVIEVLAEGDANSTMVNISGDFWMDAADTCTVTALLSGEASDVADINNGANHNLFSGHLIG